MSLLYDAVAGRVFGLCVRVLVDHHQAEEVAHESFIEIWRCAGRFEPDKGTPAAWIFAIVHRRAVDRVRSAPAAPLRELRYSRAHHAIEFYSTSEVAVGRVDGERSCSAMTCLTPLQRQSITLVYFEGLTQSEVAAALGVPLGTVKTCIRDGLIRLRAGVYPVAG